MSSFCTCCRLIVFNTLRYYSQISILAYGNIFCMWFGTEIVKAPNLVVNSKISYAIPYCLNLTGEISASNARSGLGNPCEKPHDIWFSSKDCTVCSVYSCGINFYQQLIVTGSWFFHILDLKYLRRTVWISNSCFHEDQKF